MLECGDVFVTRWQERKGSFVGFDKDCKLVTGSINAIIKNEANYVQLLIQTDKEKEFNEKLFRLFKKDLYKIEYNGQLANLRTQTQINVYDVVNETIRGLSVFVYLKFERDLKHFQYFLFCNKNFFHIYDVNFTNSSLQRFFEKEKRVNVNFVKYGILRNNTLMGSEKLPHKHKICSFDIEAVSNDVNSVPNGMGSDDMIVAVSFVLGTIVDELPQERKDVSGSGNGSAVKLVKDREIVYLLWPHDTNLNLNCNQNTSPLRTYLFFKKEIDMLKSICNFFLNELDTPFLVGYNILNFDFPFILNRMLVLGLARDYYTVKEINNMLRGTKYPIPCCERFQVVDLMIYLKKMHQMDYTSFSLNSVAWQELKKRKLDISFKELNLFYQNGSVALTADNIEFIQKLCDYVVLDSELTLEIYTVKAVHSNLFPLINVCFADTIDYTSNTPSKIISRFLSIMFPAQGLCSFRSSKSQKGGEDLESADNSLLNTGDMFKSAKQYRGATVMKTPRLVLANKNLSVVDVSSLYPSIIREYNVCKNYVIEDFVPSLYPADVVQEFLKRTHKMERFYTIKRAYSKSPLSIIVEYLIEQRKRSKNPHLNYAFKLIANSIYGLLASKGQMRHLASAALITSYGRHVHSLVKQYIEEKLQLKVVYGDTDSFFIVNPTANDEIDIASVLNKYIRDVLKLETISLTLDYESVTTVFLAEKKTYLMKLKNGNIKCVGLMKRINPNFKEYFYTFIKLLLDLIHEHFKCESEFRRRFINLIDEFFSGILAKTPKEHFMFVCRVKPYYEYKDFSSFNAICSFRRWLLGGVDAADFTSVGELFLSFVLPVCNTDYQKRKKSDCVEFFDRILKMNIPIDKLEYLKKIFNFIPILERHILKTDNLFLKFLEKHRKVEINSNYYSYTGNKNVWQQKNIFKRSYCKVAFYYDDLFKHLAEYNVHFWGRWRRCLNKQFRTVINVGQCGVLTHTTGELFSNNGLKKYLERRKNIKCLNILLLPKSNFIVNSNESLIWFLDILYAKPKNFYPQSKFHFTPDNRLIVVDEEDKIDIFTA